jgi:predicted DNA-binding protein
MSMFNERLQVLISPEQRRRLDEEATRRGASVASVVREAIDARLGAVTAGDRRLAIEHIAGMNGRFLPVEELEAIVEDERAENLPALG